MIKKFYISSQNAFGTLVLLIWMQSILLSYVRAAIMRLPIVGTYPDFIISMVYAVLILGSLNEIKFTKKDFIFTVTIIIVFWLQWCFYKEGSEYIERYFSSFILKAFPLYFIGLNLGNSVNKDAIIYHMYIISMVTIVANIGYRYFFSAPMNEIVSLYEGSMDLAYKLLPHCCLVVYYAFKKKNVWNIMLAIIGGLYLLMLGTRGAALIYLALIVLLLIIGKQSKWFIVRALIVLSVIITFLMSPLYIPVILWMYQKATQFGLSVRIFDKLLSGEVALSTGRDSIREVLLQAIKYNPIWGNGLCSDRVLANNYAHNLAIELWVEFGVLLGSVLIISCIIVLVKGYFQTNSDEARGLALSLIFASFLKLFLSGSYLDERLLFFLIGFCVSHIRRYKNRNIVFTA